MWGKHRTALQAEGVKEYELSCSQVLVLSEVVVDLLQTGVCGEGERDGPRGAGHAVLLPLCLKGVRVHSVSVIEHHVVLEGLAATVER